jgi:phosphoribosyl-ATP pyrophosphohydrolase
VREECSETIIAAKNSNNAELSNEICDLIYHLTVLMVQQGVAIEDVYAILDERSKKIGNLKTVPQDR